MVLPAGSAAEAAGAIRMLAVAMAAIAAAVDPTLKLIDSPCVRGGAQDCPQKGIPLASPVRCMPSRHCGHDFKHGPVPTTRGRAQKAVRNFVGPGPGSGDHGRAVGNGRKCDRSLLPKAPAQAELRTWMRDLRRWWGLPSGRSLHWGPLRSVGGPRRVRSMTSG